MTQLQIHLYRDSFNTPWGFRLQGGKDLGQALSVQRVFSNSPAEGELQRGDLILAIGGRDGNDLTHKMALDLIKHGGGQIQLVIQRPAPGQVTSPVTFKPQRPRAPSLQQPPPSQQPTSYGFQPKKITLSSLGGGGPCFGSDYTGGGHRPSVTQPVHVHTGPKSPGHSVEMLNKVQESLDNISLSPRTPDYGFQGPAFPVSPSSGGEQYIPTGVRLDMEREQEAQRKQQLKNNPPYVPTAVRIDQQMAASGKSLSPRSPALAPWSRQNQQNDAADRGPAWKSTLKPTSIKPWDADLDYVPSQHQAPYSTGFVPQAMKQASPAAHYTPAAPAHSGGDEQDGPKVVHLQYNSPMGLYSNQNIQETFAGQTKAMAAAGALSPGGTHMAQNGGAGSPRPGDRDWSQSAVFQMIYEDEHRGGHRPPPFHSQQHQHQQQQYQPPPPQPAPKPQVQSYHQHYAPTLDEFGTSDF